MSLSPELATCSQTLANVEREGEREGGRGREGEGGREREGGRGREGGREGEGGREREGGRGREGGRERGDSEVKVIVRTYVFIARAGLTS